jgi:peptide chain release factor 2
VLIDLGETEQEVAGEINVAEQKFNQFELENLLGGEHDKSNAIFSIHAGAGGTESCDWANMLLRMYQRYCETRGFKADLVDIQSGDEAGIKSATMLVTGEYAYGYLKAERGVHRLVRISPFDSNKRRHTSFASVDVIAELSETDEVELKTEDIQVDTFRSGGRGGQQGRDGRAHDACPDGDRGPMPKRAQPASKPRIGDQDAESAFVREAAG